MNRRSICFRLPAMWMLSHLLLPGCNIVGPAAYLVEGPPKVDAQHQLADLPTVVFIDDRRNLVNPVSLRRVIADRASQDLMAKEALSKTISPQDAMNIVRQKETTSQVLSIEEIGEAIGAQQVIYVEVVQFQDSPDGVTPRPVAACRVKVIDVASRQRVFPPVDSDDPARLVQVMTREVDPEVYRTRSGRLKIFEGLAEATGREIAKLFYKHEAVELGGRLNPR